MKKIWLILIILLSFFLRFYKLGSFPALNADEAAIGYNAYSLIKTGLDEHANPWPIHFQSFNDFKPGLYFYLSIPFIKFGGLNEWSVRFPGAILGVLTVLILYYLTKELFNDEKVSLFSSLFLAISPWHIHFSRGAWEVNASTFLIILGLYLFIKGIKKGNSLLVLGIVSLVLSLYTYHAARVIAPLLGLGLVIFYRNELKKNLKLFTVSLVVGIILVIPLVADFTKSGAVSRLSGVGLFADIGPISRINEQRGEHTKLAGLFSKLLHNKPVNYSLAFLENWSDHFWGEFLFLSGDVIQRNRVPETGQMYLYDLIFIVFGIITVIKKPKNWGIILWWLIVAPMAAAFTFQSPHALRVQNMVIPLITLSAFGFVNMIDWFKRTVNKKTILMTIYCIFGLTITWSFARYLHMYWVHMAKEYPYSSQYGVKEMVGYVLENQDKYKKIFITDKYDQPYILYLFYSKYPPEKFQGNHTLTPRDKFGFSTIRDFDKFYFEAIDFNKVKSGNQGSLIIGTKEEIPDGEKVTKIIYFPNGEIAFKIVANQL